MPGASENPFPRGAWRCAFLRQFSPGPLSRRAKLQDSIIENRQIRQVFAQGVPGCPDFIERVCGEVVHSSSFPIQEWQRWGLPDIGGQPIVV